MVLTPEEIALYQELLRFRMAEHTLREQGFLETADALLEDIAGLEAALEDLRRGQQPEQFAGPDLEAGVPRRPGSRPRT